MAVPLVRALRHGQDELDSSPAVNPFQPSTATMLQRREQLKRWESSETNREPAEKRVRRSSGPPRDRPRSKPIEQEDHRVPLQPPNPQSVESADKSAAAHSVRFFWCLNISFLF